MKQFSFPHNRYHRNDALLISSQLNRHTDLPFALRLNTLRSGPKSLFVVNPFETPAPPKVPEQHQSDP